MMEACGQSHLHLELVPIFFSVECYQPYGTYLTNIILRLYASCKYINTNRMSNINPRNSSSPIIQTYCFSFKQRHNRMSWSSSSNIADIKMNQNWSIGHTGAENEYLLGKLRTATEFTLL